MTLFTKCSVAAVGIGSSLFCGNLGAVTVNVNSVIGTPSPNFVTSDNLPLGPGTSTIRIGYFDTSDAGKLATIQTSNSFSAVDILFTPILEGTDGGGNILAGTSGITDFQRFQVNNVGGTGEFFGTIENVSLTRLPASAQLYFWVFNDDSPSASSSEWGIFSSTSTLWDFPTDDLGTATMATADIDVIHRGSLTGSGLALSPIPEPSVPLFGLAGALILSFRRRR